jgi:hypothetical protein
MRFSTTLAALALAACSVVPAFAQEIDQQMRQQIEAVHMKWLEALNKGDVDAFSTTYTRATVQIDAFGRTVGVNAEFVQGVHKKGIVLSMPIDGVQALKGGQAAIAYYAEAVVLDLVNPVRPSRRLIGTAGQAWLDEVGNRAGTQTRRHAVESSGAGAGIRVRSGTRS